MKKLAKNLHLRRETLLALDRLALPAAVGGSDVNTTVKPRTQNTCNSVCQCTS